MLSFAARSLDVLDLLAHLLDQHLHVHADAREFQRRRLGAQRVGLAGSSWIRKSSRLPISPPFLSSRSISSRCGSAASVPRPRRCGSRRRWPRSVRGPGPPRAACRRRWRPGPWPPALEETGALLFHQLRHQRAGLGDQFAQLARCASSILASRAPSRWRSRHQRLERLGATSSRSAPPVAARRRRRPNRPAAGISATLSSSAPGSQPRMPSCTPVRRCSSLTEGSPRRLVGGGASMAAAQLDPCRA